MNLEERFSLSQKNATGGRPITEVIPEQMSREEIRARSEASLRRHMKNQGSTDAEVDAYLAQSSAPHAMAA